MAEKVEDLTVDYTEDDILKVKEIDKVVLSKGAWATIMFRYQQWDFKNECYGPDKYTIRRYRKLGGEYKAQGKFNISSKDQAGKIVNTLSEWIK